MTDAITAPLVLAPQLCARPWAGARLAPASRGIGESWLTGPSSTVVVGPGEGHALDELVSRWGEALVGSHGAVLGRGRRFPVLIKLIDTSAWLSVQVHPDDAQALVLEGEPGIGKSESWVVLDAGPRAELMVGRDALVAPEAIRAAIGSEALLALLWRVRPSVGDRVTVAPGTLHALGPDLLVYEIQQPSDITYRVWDWGRVGRELHVDQTRAVVDPSVVGRLDPPVDPASHDSIVARSPFYVARRILLGAGDGASRLDLATDGTTPHVITVVDGAAEVAGRSGTVPAALWGSVVVAASAGEYAVQAQDGPATILIASVP